MAALYEIINNSPEMWQDKKIMIRSDQNDLKLCNGEICFRIFDKTGRNPKKNGYVMITNLRIIFDPKSLFSVNSTIGYSTIVSIDTVDNKDNSKNYKKALRILTRFDSEIVEFFFMYADKSVFKRFTYTLNEAYECYNASWCLRHIAINTSDDAKDNLTKFFPKESLCTKHRSVWKVDQDSGQIGTYYSTNIRIMWICDIEQKSNISIPYISICKISIRKTIHGLCIVIETFLEITIGFRCDSADTLQSMYEELSKLAQVNWESPIFGFLEEIKLYETETEIQSEELQEKPTDDVGEFFDVVRNQDPAFCVAVKPASVGVVPVFSNELGLAIEPLPENMTIKKIWSLDLN